MSGFKIKIDDKEFKELLRKLAKSPPAVARKALESWGQDMVRTTIRRMEAGVTPAGIPWPPRRKDGGKRRLAKSDIRRTLHSEYHAARMAIHVGTPSVYGAIHQFGGIIRAKSPKKYLTIPLTKLAKKKRARNIEDLFFIKSRKGNKLLVRKKGKSLKGKKAKLELMYLLRPSVKIPAARWLGTSERDLSDLGIHIVNAWETLFFLS